MPTNAPPMTVPPELEEQLRAMRREIDAHDQARTKLIRRRDDTIRKAHAAGGSLREVAELIGLSHMAVRDVVRRDE